jgi:hypothetical protein
VSIEAAGASGQVIYSSSPFSFRTPGSTTGAEEFVLSQTNTPGRFQVKCPTYASGQTTRLQISYSLQEGLSASAPSSGTWQRGDRVVIRDPSAADYLEWVCVADGTPGTWVKGGLIASAIGYVVPDTFIINKSERAVNELVASSLSSNQNDYSPANLTDAAVLLLTSSTPVSITGIATPANGRKLYVYNSGTNNITLTNQDALSTAANRIIGRGGANVVLTPSTGCLLYYSPSLTRWIVMSDTL